MVAVSTSPGVLRDQNNENTMDSNHGLPSKREGSVPVRAEELAARLSKLQIPDVEAKVEELFSLVGRLRLSDNVIDELSA